MEPIDEKLARIDRRFEARRLEVQRHLADRPEILELATLCREVFNARLAYLQVGDWETGDPDAHRRLDDGTLGVCVPVSPPYARPIPAGRGKAAAMRKREGR